MRRHSLGCHADRLLTAAIDFVRCGDVCEGFRHGGRRRRQLGADLRGYSEESSAEAFLDLLRRRRRRTGLRSDAETSGMHVLEATEFGRLERGLLLGPAGGFFKSQLFSRTAGFAIGLGLEGGLRNSLGRAATSGRPLRESRGRSCLGRGRFRRHCKSR